jgi:hypothetical protein
LLSVNWAGRWNRIRGSQKRMDALLHGAQRRPAGRAVRRAALAHPCASRHLSILAQWVPARDGGHEILSPRPFFIFQQFRRFEKAWQFSNLLLFREVF